MKKILIKRLLLAAVAVVLIGGIIFLFYHPRFLKQTVEAIRSLGMWAPPVYFLFFIVATFFFAPIFFLMFSAGVLFGVWTGTVVISSAATTAAALGFLASRYTAREWVRKKIKTQPAFESIQTAMKKRGWKIILMARLAPIFPFHVVNGVFGLTRVHFLEFLLVSWLGMLPGSFMNVYLGSLAGQHLAGEKLSAGLPTAIVFAWSVLMVLWAVWYARRVFKSKPAA